MVKITKVYTKTGDKGETHLAAGKRASKISPRIEAIGCLDELNSFIGLAVANLADNNRFISLIKKLLFIQNTLFDLGAQLVVLKEDRRENTPQITENDIHILETEIDEMNGELPALNSFVLPSGNETSARLHVVRAVCRRTERAVVQLAIHEELDDLVIPYLNRLSDWLFVAARYVIVKSGVEEILWQPGKR